MGEYGSVIFIAGNIPQVSEIAPLLIITKLEQYDYAGATAIAVVMLVASFALLLGINMLQAWARNADLDADERDAGTDCQVRSYGQRGAGQACPHHRCHPGPERGRLKALIRLSD